MRKLTKKNTKMNRTALGSGEASVSQPAMRRDPARKTKVRQAAADQRFLRFSDFCWFLISREQSQTYYRRKGRIFVSIFLVLSAQLALRTVQANSISSDWYQPDAAESTIPCVCASVRDVVVGIVDRKLQPISNGRQSISCACERIG